MKQVIENYPDKVRWIYRHFPLDSIHDYARKAAEASECAGDQGRFWEYTDKLFENYKSINTDFISIVAEGLKLDIPVFNECLSSGKYKAKVSNDLAMGQQAGVRGTPGSFINGQHIKGSVPYSVIQSAIKLALSDSIKTN
jgi:protein-disulfide isomerase